MVRQLADIRQRGGTRIFMATTPTRIAIMPTILAITPTILSIPPWLATGTIIALAGRGAVMTRSQLVERQPRAGTFAQRHARMFRKACAESRPPGKGHSTQ